MLSILLVYLLGCFCGLVAIIIAGFFLPENKNKRVEINRTRETIAQKVKIPGFFSKNECYIVSAAVGLLFTFFYIWGYTETKLAFLCVFTICLTSISLVDAKSMMIPNILVVGALFIGLLYQIVAGSIWAGFAGAFTGALPVLCIYILSRGGIGFGDVKLIFVLGLWIGGYYSLYILMAGSLLAGGVSVYGLVSKRLTLKSPIPFGPFLCIGWYCTVILFGG